MNRVRLFLIMIMTVAMTAGLGLTSVVSPASARVATMTNTAHLDFLLDRVALTAVPGHTTYRLATEPEVMMPWTYADARPGGAFARVGGGKLDPATGYYGQGAFNADDISRAAVVYLRHWRQFGDEASREHAYELLRGLTYLQTTTGAHRGNVVLWIQADGTLNPSPKPVELPDPSDSGPSYWTARTIWALGEGYAAFAADDPTFAGFLQDRLQLSVGAVQRQVLSRYGQYRISDGRRVPAWLIVNGADATAEATLGLLAYVTAAPGDRATRTALRQLLEGVAVMATPREGWPYGAVLPWAESRSMWHAWASQMAGALARGSVALDRPALLRPAIVESVSFDPTLLTANGPDNGWYPTPVDTVQIAYGVDSRVQNLLTTADAAGRPGLRALAAMNASWFFGANRAGAVMYDPATGVTFDGLQADGTVNHNSGAESTIHGLLTMLALDAHPAVRTQAVGWTTAPVRAGLQTVEAESADPTTGSVVTPESAWTGESQWSGGQYLRLRTGQQARISLPVAGQVRTVEPVSWLPVDGTARSRWTFGPRRTATLKHRVGASGISVVPGALLPQSLAVDAPAGRTAVTVQANRGPVMLDAVIVRPLVSRARFSGSGGTTELLTSIADRRQSVRTEVSGPATASRYDRQGRLVARTAVTRSKVVVEAGGFTVVTPSRT